MPYVTVLLGAQLGLSFSYLQNEFVTGNWGGGGRNKIYFLGGELNMSTLLETTSQNLVVQIERAIRHHDVNGLYERLLQIHVAIYCFSQFEETYDF